MKISAALLRLGAFLVIAGLFAVMEITTLTGPHVGTTDSYAAIFGGPDGVSGLRTGNPVRVAGVAVGKVTAVDLVDAQHAKVTFTANRNQKITTHTYAVVRYANLLGQRFLALTEPSGKPGAVLAPGSTIPMQRTAPALSLTDLFNGFRPLFTALTPQQVNELSQDIIDVLQGQTGRIQDLIARTADLTGNLSNRDATFRSVVDGVATLLGTVAQHDAQLAAVVNSLRSLTDALHAEGPAIIGSVQSVDALIGSVADLFGQLNDHGLQADVADAASLTRVLAANSGTETQLISGFASAFETFSRVSQDGNWINVYACNVGVITYGSPTVTVGQFAGSLVALLGSVPGLAGAVSNVLSGLGLGSGVLAGLPGLPTPLNLPNGQVGTSNQHTKVCS